FEEGIVGGVVAKIDIVVHYGRHLVVAGVGVLKRHDFRAGFRQFGFLVLGGGGAGGSARQRRRLEGRAAFRAEDGVSVQIEKFRAAILALALAAELRFGQWSKSPVVILRQGPGRSMAIGRWGYSRHALLSIRIDRESLPKERFQRSGLRFA